jgi:hypothetical protein
MLKQYSLLIASATLVVGLIFGLVSAKVLNSNMGKNVKANEELVDTLVDADPGSMLSATKKLRSICGNLSGRVTFDPRGYEGRVGLEFVVIYTCLER